MKRTETIGKKPDQIFVSLRRYLSRLPHLISSHQPNPPPPLPLFRYLSCAKHVSRRRSTVQNYSPPPSPRSFAPQRSASSSSSITIPPSDGSKTAPCLTQPPSYLASRTPGILIQTPTALYHFRGLRFSDRRPVPFVTRIFTGLKRRRASDSLVGKDVDGIESRHRVADATPQISSSRVNPQCERTGEALIQALRSYSPSSSTTSMSRSNWSSLTITTIREERQ